MEQFLEAMSAERFNAYYPIGTRVHYYPLVSESKSIPSLIRSIAWELGSGEVVVKIKSISGGVSILHLSIDEKRICKNCEELDEADTHWVPPGSIGQGGYFTCERKAMPISDDAFKAGKVAAVKYAKVRINKFKALSTRRGIINIQHDFFRDNIDLVQEIFKVFIPTKAEFDYNMDQFVFHGISELFASLSPNTIASTYIFTFNSEKRTLIGIQ